MRCQIIDLETWPPVESVLVGSSRNYIRIVSFTFNCLCSKPQNCETGATAVCNLLQWSSFPVVCCIIIKQLEVICICSDGVRHGKSYGDATSGDQLRLVPHLGVSRRLGFEQELRWCSGRRHRRYVINQLTLCSPSISHRQTYKTSINTHGVHMMHNWRDAHHPCKESWGNSDSN